MIVLKFGGSSLSTAKLLKDVAAIVKSRHGEGPAMVVVSATGDTTDHILKAIDAAVAGKKKKAFGIIADIKKTHLRLVSDAVSFRHRGPVKSYIDEKIGHLCEYFEGITKLRECSTRARDFIVGHGELLSSALVSAVLKSHGMGSQQIDSREVFVTDDLFGQANIDVNASKPKVDSLVKPLFKKVVPVMTGFLGATKNGVPTTIGRGGSDLSGTMMGALLGAKRVEIWTDVPGVMSANPKMVKRAFSLSSLSYAEAMELAYFGAKVVHPKAVSPLAKKRIPIHILCTHDPKDKGTIISSKTKPGVIKGITSIDNIAMITLEGSGIIGMRGVAGRMFTALAKRDVNVIMISQGSSEHSVCCAVEMGSARQSMDELTEEFAYEMKRRIVSRIRCMDHLAVIAIVGEGMKGSPGVAGRLFTVLGQNAVNVIAIAQGSSEMNITFVIEKQDEIRALNLIHGAFHLSTNRANLFIIGKGTIGGKLIDQIASHKNEVLKSMDMDLRVIGIADSKKYVLADKIVDLKKWRGALDNAKSSMSSLSFIEKLCDGSLENLVIVDTTASEDIARMYPKILRNGMSIVTPNKRGNTMSMKTYREVISARGTNRARYLYETTVGAGLPVISTLRDLIDSGDRILEIKGIFSGTLSFIFSEVANGRSFSEAVVKAMELGFTEPDPRDDLCGEDVARKVLILARELGRSVEMCNVKVENLVPADLRNVSPSKFMSAIGRMDDRFARLHEKAQRAGKTLQYLGTVSGKRVEVGLTEVPSTSPFSRMKPGDNMVIFKTERYDKNPLIIQGPGAGPDVTAGGVFADILKLSQALFT